MPAKPDTAILMKRSQVEVIVDLAVVNDDEAATVGRHRLMAGRREVEDRQPPVSESDSTGFVEPDVAIVGTAMPQRLGHAFENRSRIIAAALRRSTVGIEAEKSSQSAHAGKKFRLRPVKKRRTGGSLHSTPATHASSEADSTGCYRGSIEFQLSPFTSGDSR